MLILSFLLFTCPAEMALKARREIADYIVAGKDDRARIRVRNTYADTFFQVSIFRLGIELVKSTLYGMFLVL